MPTKGLIMVHTGDGKGKTTAALGLIFRTLGHNLPVCIIQFIKGTWKYGELTAAQRFSELLEFHVMGTGFIRNPQSPTPGQQAARDGWALAQRILAENRHHLVVLDELNVALRLGLLDEAEVLQALQGKPAALHVLITGRDAPAALIAAADLVTEMREVKHPLHAGIKAQIGIEF